MRKRFVVHSRQDVPLFDLDVKAMVGEGAVRTERLKGEHKLDLTTTQELEEGLRILSRDGTLKWREWVVDEPKDTHATDGMLHEYGCTWSMQYDLATVAGGELWPGTYTPITADGALRMVLDPQTRWEVGRVTVGGTAGTTLYDGSVWEYLGTLQETWGGEMEPRIVVDGNGVTHRYVDWLAHVGNEEPTRRFDFGEDCTSIVRKVAPGPRYCRVVPRGGRDAQDADGVRYSDRCGVEEEPYREDGDFVHPANAVYISDTVAEQLFRVPDGVGGWDYPEKVVCYDLDLAGDQEELLNKAMAEVADYTRPKTTYEADVLQFEAAGMDAHGVALGDEVQIVDRAFGDVPLRLQARVVEMTVNELDETDVKLVIGEPMASLDSAFKSLARSIDVADGRARAIQAGGTIAYVEGLLDAINAQIAADGGYTYMVNGQGTITYDRAVANPLIGTEATQVVQMKGGSLRFANERNESFSGIDDWKWKTVITSEGYLGLAATIGAITAGYIGNVDGDFYIDLDGHSVRMPASSTVGGQTVDAIAQTAVDNQTQAQIFNKLTNNGAIQGLYMEGGNLYVNASYIKTGTMNAVRIESNDGESYWDLDTGQMQLYSKDTNLKIGRFTQTAGGNLIDSLIELGDGMTYTNRYGQVFKLYVDSYDSQSGATTYRNAHMQLTNTQGTAGFYLDTLSLQGSVILSSDATLYITGGEDAMNDNRTRVVINNNGTRPMCDIYGTTRANVTAWSDRRMKEHVEYLDDDACDFVRALRPALFEFREGTHQSGRHLGFYAQDVMDAEPDGWDTETVTQSADESLDFDPLTLDYNALIAPLVAYAQQLERRIDQQQEQIDALTARLDALEGGA